MSYDVEHFSYAYLSSVYLHEVYVNVIAPFLKLGCSFFWLLSFKSSLYILDNSPLSDMFLQIFSPSLWLIFLPS